MAHAAATSYRIVVLLAMAMLTVVALGWFMARDFQQSAEAAHQLYERFDEGLDLIDDILFETEEVRRILLYTLHTSDANHQLDYVEQSRAAEARVNRLLEQRSTILSSEGTRAARESVAAAWTRYLETRDEVVGLILEGSVRDGVALDEALGNARFNGVRSAIAELKSSFKADAAQQVEATRARSARATTQLGVVVVSALLLVAIAGYLVHRRQAAEAAARIKADFLTTMSHEVRTPLTGVIGITDLLQNAEIPAAQRELVRMLRTNAATLLALVNNVLDYSQIEAGLMALAPRPFSVHALVEDALDSVSEPASRKGLALGYVIDAGVPDLIADEDRVRQVLLNLLSNAVKYTDAGEVAIHVSSAMERPGTVAVTITVRDTGVGIREEFQQRLFQWFSQIQPASGHRVSGTGLGLAISDRLSRLLGGSMRVESRFGEGSTFTFVFQAEPVARQRSSVVDAAPLRGGRSSRALAREACAGIGRMASAHDTPAATHALVNPKRLAILLVEDNEPNRRVVHLMLEELGFDADEAAGGQEAVMRAEQRRYDIILMDVQMPDLDGLEATRRIRTQERDHRPTIIALTANVFESDEARCRDAGMDGYLQKPMRLDTLAAALNAGAPTAL